MKGLSCANLKHEGTVKVEGTGEMTGVVLLGRPGFITVQLGFLTFLLCRDLRARFPDMIL